MISEKTVELNLTTELVNYLFFLTNIRPFILAPSQVEEGTLGYDVNIGHPEGRGILIQYKRAIVNNQNIYDYHLNRTARQDQHLRLFILDLLGFPVYYAFPIFHTENEVINFRRELLLRTKFIRPTRIVPHGGILTGHHTVRHNSLFNTWTVHSDEGTPISNEGPLNDQFINRVMEVFRNQNEKYYLQNLLNAYNKVFTNKKTVKFKQYAIEPIIEEDLNLFRGNIILSI